MPEYSPLSSCFYNGRTPRANDEDDVVRQEWTVRRFQPSYVFSLAEEGAEPELVMVAVDRCEAAVDPFAGWDSGLQTSGCRVEDVVVERVSSR